MRPVVGAGSHGANGAGAHRQKAMLRNAVVLLLLALGGVFLWRKSVEERVIEANEELTVSVPYGEEVTYAQLSTLGCRQTEAVRVCSHRANAHELKVENGSLQAYQALWDQGIRCFDVDFVATADGFMVATHPDRLQQTIGSAIGDVRQTLKDNTIIIIRSLGADDDRFPITDVLFEHFGKLIKETEPKPWLDSKTQPNYRSAPTIFMELKGDGFAKDNIWNAFQHAEKHGVTDNVALYTLNSPQDYLLKHEGVWRGPKIRGYWDYTVGEDGSRRPNNPDPREEDIGVYAMIGPSVKLGKGFYKAARSLEKPIHSWVVDTPEELFFALEMGVDSIISNVPLSMNALLGRWRQGCRSRFPSQKGWLPEDA